MSTQVAIEWECTECGYIYEGKRPPSSCPDCSARGAWEKVAYEWPGDDDDTDD